MELELYFSILPQDINQIIFLYLDIYDDFYINILMLSDTNNPRWKFIFSIKFKDLYNFIDDCKNININGVNWKSLYKEFISTEPNFSKNGDKIIHLYRLYKHFPNLYKHIKDINFGDIDYNWTFIYEVFCAIPIDRRENMNIVTLRFILNFIDLHRGEIDLWKEYMYHNIFRYIYLKNNPIMIKLTDLYIYFSYNYDMYENLSLLVYKDKIKDDVCHMKILKDDNKGKLFKEDIIKRVGM